MSLDEKFATIRVAINDKVGELFEQFASQYGYPNNPGIRTFAEVVDKQQAGIGLKLIPTDGVALIDKLPKRISSFPPVQRPETYFEMIFGPVPRVDTVSRYSYETQDEGFYNFYVENYRNTFFMPDWLSEFIQVKLNFCMDLSGIEIAREIMFVGLVIFSQLILLRIAIAWFLSINPYLFPWSYLIATVDWTEELLQGVIPSLFGVNLTGSIFLGAIGVVADGLNHLILTMPYLPSEGEATQLSLNGKLKEVVVFHYLPSLWYTHPIPNDLREYWFSERPDILEYMKTAYSDLNLHLLPDSYIIHQQEMVGFSLLTDNFHITF